MDIIIGFVLSFTILSILQLVTFFFKMRTNKKMYSVFINNEFKEEIPYGARTNYFNRVKYNSTIRMSVDKKKRKINISVDYI